MRAGVVDAMRVGFKTIVVNNCVGECAQVPHDAGLIDMEQKCAEVWT